MSNRKDYSDLAYVQISSSSLTGFIDKNPIDWQDKKEYERHISGVVPIRAVPFIIVRSCFLRLQTERTAEQFHS